MYLTETDLTELTRSSVLLGRSVKVGEFDRPTYRPRLTSDVPVPTYVPTEAYHIPTEQLGRYGHYYYVLLCITNLLCASTVLYGSMQL